MGQIHPTNERLLGSLERSVATRWTYAPCFRRIRLGRAEMLTRQVQDLIIKWKNKGVKNIVNGITHRDT